MFYDNKYTNFYFSIINKYGLKSKPSYYTERHHIIPKSLGGSNDIENLIYVSPKVHYILHLLLIKMVRNPEHIWKMAFAIHAMSSWNRRRRYTSKLYEIHRKLYITKLKGYKDTAETKIRKSVARLGDKNPRYNNPHSEESKKKISENQKKRLKEFNPWNGKKHHEESKKKISKTKKRNYIKTKWMNKNDIQCLIKISDIDLFLSNGWNFGKLYSPRKKKMTEESKIKIRNTMKEKFKPDKLV